MVHAVQRIRAGATGETARRMPYAAKLRSITDDAKIKVPIGPQKWTERG